MFAINLQSSNIQLTQGILLNGLGKFSMMILNIRLKLHCREPTIYMTETGATTRTPYNVWNSISQPHIDSGSQVVAYRYLPQGGIIKLCNIET